MRLSVLAVALLATDASGYAPAPPHDYMPGFELTGRIPDAGTAGAGSAGSRIVAVGDDALAIDADSGQLLLANVTGHRIASLPIGADAGLLVYDPASRRAFVADRAHDRVAIVAVDHGQLTLAGTIATPAEPYGLALAGDTLLVTSIADRVLVAYDAAGSERWREPVAAEPRAVAVAPDGKHALVTHLTAGDVELFDLASHHAQTRALRRDLDPQCTRFQNDEKSSLQCADPDGTSYARGAYTALFLGPSLAAVAFERETPVPRPQFEQAQHYGGRAIPITRHVALVGVGGAQAVAQITAAEPRSLAYDAGRDLLYIAGMGDDRLVVVERATHHDAHLGDWLPVRESATDRCGIDGLALASDGDLLVWCSFHRAIARVRVDKAEPKAIPPYVATQARGPELAASRFDDQAHAGFVRFHSASSEISEFGREACASCHLEGRSDGLAWKIEGHALRTPVLAGRVAGTAPYKWAGSDADLDHGIMATIDRLGGRHGKFRDDYQFKGPDPIAAYLTALAPPRSPTLSARAVARGKALFDDLGCASCHAGAEFTDHARHAFAGAPFEIDTPSLRGASAAPRYLHDGSATTLDDVLAETGSIRGMIPRPLAADERADLAAFIRSL